MPVSRNPEQLAVRTVEAVRRPGHAKRTPAPARLITPVTGDKVIDTDHSNGTTKVLLLCADEVHTVAVTHDEKRRVVRISLRLTAAADLSDHDRRTLDRVQATALMARIDPDEDSRAINILAVSLCAHENTLQATLDLLAADVGRVLLDDRLQGLVQG